MSSSIQEPRTFWSIVVGVLGVLCLLFVNALLGLLLIAGALVVYYKYDVITGRSGVYPQQYAPTRPQPYPPYTPQYGGVQTVRYCTNCGKQIATNVRFCNFCGAEQKSLQ